MTQGIMDVQQQKFEWDSQTFSGPFVLKESETLAILFADIVQSTRYYETLGDERAQLYILKCLTCLSDVVSRHDGTVVKTIGDEIMCAFPNADRAVNAAKGMHLALERMPVAKPPTLGTPNAYVGIHIGSVIREPNDLYGDAVNLAARAVALAKPRQILITEPLVKSLSRQYQSSVRFINVDTLKGKSGPVKVYEYVWEQNDITAVLEPISSTSVPSHCLELKCGAKFVTVDEQHPQITIGRQGHNDLVLDDRRISRSHARIEFRRGKFILIDDSLNGTHIRFKTKKSVYLKQDETVLNGNGIISLGRKATPRSQTAIHFRII